MQKPNDEGVPPVTCSVGVAFGRVGLDVSELFKRADNALYKTKQNGRNGLTFYRKSDESDMQS